MEFGAHLFRRGRHGLRRAAVVATAVTLLTCAAVAPARAGVLPPPPPGTNEPAAPTVTVKHGSTVLFDGAVWPAFSLFQSYHFAKTDLQAAIVAQLRPQIESALDGQATLASLSAVIDDGLALSFTGSTNGTVIINVTLPRISLYAKAHKDGIGDAYVTIQAGPVPLQASYNIFTGLVDNVQLLVPEVPISTSISIDADWWVDLLNFFSFGTVDLVIDYLADQLNDELHNQLQGALAAYLSTKALANVSTYVWGLDSVLPDDLTFNGVDVDQLIRDAIAGAIVGPQISIAFQNPDIWLQLWGEYSVDFHYQYGCVPDPRTGVCGISF